MQNIDRPVIVAPRRGPIGRARKGSLAKERPEDLALSVIRSTMNDVPQLDPADIEDFYLGCAVPEGMQNENIARRIAVLAGFDGLPGATVNRFCASSLQAARMAAHAIIAGEGTAYLVGGVESVSSQSPRELYRHPAFDEALHASQNGFDIDSVWTDPREKGLLPDVYCSMGLTAENVARATGTSRRDQDEWAYISQMRATRAQTSGFFAKEIVEYVHADGSVTDRDDGIRPSTTPEVLAGLAPAFLPIGTVTAGNSSPLNDGASAALIMNSKYARDLGVPASARILATAVTALSPEIMGLGPIQATRMALHRAGMTIDDVDIIELNEAFAAQVVPTIRELGADPERVNPFGGAIALGHPFGSTGVRLLATLINGLSATDGTIGLATLCVGGGQGMSMIVERVQ